jgi:HD superfamily phosphodiesterase
MGRSPTKLLRLEAAMNTEAGRAEARRHTEFMRAFLRQLGQEIGESMPDASDLARVDGV